MRIGTAVVGLAAFAFSVGGFIKRVGTVPAFFGYLGFVLMACTLLAWWRQWR